MVEREREDVKIGERKLQRKVKAQMKNITNELHFINDKFDDYEQVQRNCDVVFDNINAEVVRDARDITSRLVNDTIMGSVIERNDIKKLIYSKTKKSSKMTVIATLCSETDKKNILTHKKIFQKQKHFY